MGSATGLEQDLIRETDTTFDGMSSVQAGPLHGVNPLKALVSLIRLAIGTLQALVLLRRWRPHAAFFTGGWVSVPVAVAAYLLRVPSVIFVPDIEPGLTLKVLGRFASAITATTAETSAFFPSKRVIATGYPLRQEVLSATRPAAQAHFKLASGLPTLLIFGGSRGARSINQALMGQLAAILAQVEYHLQVIHVTGSLDWVAMQTRYQALPREVQERYHMFEYLHDDMGLAMAAADVVVSRAGASCLGEFPYFGLPSVLVPYPHAWRYQRVNADWLVRRGAGVLLLDETLDDQLTATMVGLLKDSSRLKSLGQAAQALRIENGAERIAQVIMEQVG